jgi:hypothetical protein
LGKRATQITRSALSDPTTTIGDAILSMIAPRSAAAFL